VILEQGGATADFFDRRDESTVASPKGALPPFLGAASLACVKEGAFEVTRQSGTRWKLRKARGKPVAVILTERASRSPTAITSAE
jgi:cytochrome oxidase Cu insertion factor (SCO1/SenC/PrrC family)